MDDPVPPTRRIRSQESSEINRDERQKSWLEAGILLALSTLVGYLVAYSYEEGFCRHFSIPLSFIEITPSL